MSKLPKKVYGPYSMPTGRTYVQIRYTDGTRCCKSYPKYLLELELGRELSDNESVHHIDGDFTNNSRPNLTILSCQQHSSLDARRLIEERFVCAICGDGFSLSGNRLSCAIQNRKDGMAGPFCSKSCAGKYGTSIQHHGEKPLPATQIRPKYRREKMVNSV